MSLYKNLLLPLALVLTGAQAHAEDDWSIGTGFLGLNIEVDEAFTTALGPIDFGVGINVMVTW